MTEGGPRQILSLSMAALVVLVAEPLYLLVDTAVVGRLGAVDLAALDVGAVVLAQVSSLGTFLAYGTTARAARAFGAGHRDRAVVGFDIAGAEAGYPPTSSARPVVEAKRCVNTEQCASGG